MDFGLQGIALTCTLLALAGAAYYVLCAWAGLRFLSQQRESAAMTPPVSILKSLKGVDPHMAAAFRSHCLLDYPEYEVLFGVSDMSDPAVSLVHELQQEFPNVRLRVIHCPELLGTNGKVSNLAQMLPQAQLRACADQRQRHPGHAGFPAARRWRHLPIRKLGLLPRFTVPWPDAIAGLEAGGAGHQHRLHGRGAGGARDGSAASVSRWARP